MSYKEDLEIDIYSLEEECADQPRRFMRWSEEFAQALIEKDRAKQNLKVVTAQTSLQVRLSLPQDYGLDKWTENSVQAILDTHPLILQAEEDYFQAIKNLEILKSAKEAFQDRRTQLTNLVSLRNAQYYADPVIESRRREERSQRLQQEILEAEMSSKGE